MTHIDSFVQFTETLLTGAQPKEDDFQKLKENNVDVVVNLSPYNTPNFLQNEPQIVQDLGMNYFHYPIDCTTLHEYQYEYFQGLMKMLEGKKLFIHCGGNVKSSGFLYIYLVNNGYNKDELDSKLKELNRHDEKWYNYFEKMVHHS